MGGELRLCSRAHSPHSPWKRINFVVGLTGRTCEGRETLPRAWRQEKMPLVSARPWGARHIRATPALWLGARPATGTPRHEPDHPNAHSGCQGGGKAQEEEPRAEKAGTPERTGWRRQTARRQACGARVCAEVTARPSMFRGVTSPQREEWTCRQQRRPVRLWTRGDGGLPYSSAVRVEQGGPASGRAGRTAPWTTC